MKYLFFALFVSFFSLIPLTASSHYDGPSFDPHIQNWYKSLKQPGTNVGCCDVSDCHNLESDHYKVDKNGKWSILIDSSWIEVPENVILKHKKNPTGYAVACYYDSSGDGDAKSVYFYCFVPPMLT